MIRRGRAADVAVVGGGLAGLAASIYLAHRRLSVVLLEKAATLGGRARTTVRKGICFNLGPHALYRGGRGIGVLTELGIPFTGGSPALSGGYAIRQGTKHTLPVGSVSLLTTGLLAPPAKLEAARLLASLPHLQTKTLAGVTVFEWLEQAVVRPEVREVLAALVRLATYAHDPDRQSAAAALAQLQLAQQGVLYLDGGWQSLVDGLRRAAEDAGVRVITGAGVAEVERDQAVRGVRVSDGTRWEASSVILAVGPAQARDLVERGQDTVLARWAEEAVSVRAASLDVALRRLPRPRALFALGIDTSLYVSVHSAAARLSSADGVVIHAAKYLGSSPPSDPQAIERELEELLEMLQPGWRRVVMWRRFLPNLVVTNALVTAAQGGTGGRPGPEVPGVSGLYVAGDWVGSEGMLTDAALASARSAALRALHDRAGQSGGSA